LSTPVAILRRLAASAAALMLCAAISTTAGVPTAEAASGRDLLAGAIANTRGSYLVYNFGGGHPAPMLNAAGSWYELGNGGHLMIIKSASQRLAPRLLVDSHNGYQSRCERDPRARTGEGLLQASEVLSPLKHGRRWDNRPSRSTPTSSISVGRRGARGSRPAAVHHWAPTSTTRVDRGVPTRR
jgi:hypothetical protein